MHHTKNRIVCSKNMQYDANCKENYHCEEIMIIEAILLGLSTGTYCTMNCAPVLIPFLCGNEDIRYKKNAGLVGTFLLSRLIMYFILGAVFAILGLLVNTYMNPVLSRKLSIYAYIFSGLALLFNSLGVRFPWGSKEHGGCKVSKLRRIGNDWITMILAGLAVGLHICPPLWTAMIRSIFGGNGIPGLFYFVFFYIGTLPFFIPLLGIPFITKRISVLKNIARVTQFLISIYFVIFLGAIPLFFG